VLLELRILKFQNDRLSSLMLSALALVISFLLVWYIGRGLNNSFIQISGNSKKLIVSSNNQKMVSKSMVANATETSAQANAIASAAEEVSVNIQSVASAAEEIGATIREIARQSQQAAQVANEAVSIAETGNKAVLRLGENSNIIGNVIKVITSIAEQTNLLALNASIEAARAGEFGKGFAVVASEVKELAKETAKATEDIRTKIEGIQSDTREAVSSNEKTRNIISKIHEIQSTIAGAVEEQAATTREITRNAADAATGSSEIAKNISGLAEAARSTSKGATELETAALGLDIMASELEKIVKTFQIKS
jgi:methyl-accepting chemotaxis protein